MELAGIDGTEAGARDFRKLKHTACHEEAGRKVFRKCPVRAVSIWKGSAAEGGKQILHSF